MNNIKYLLIFIVLVMGSVFVFNFNQQDEKIKPDRSHLTVTALPNKEEKAKKLTEQTNNKKHYNQASAEVLKRLKPPSTAELEFVWQDEYGCSFQDDEGLENCKYKFLKAHSYKEAVWMKNNAYPTKSMLDLAEDPAYQDQLVALARDNYPPALTISAIKAMEAGYYREASNSALSAIAYSDRSKTFPHVLYGEALLLDNKKILGVTQFYVAGLLGDFLANGRAIGLSPNTPYSTTALNSAHRYLRNKFGANYPYDPRPMGEEEPDI